MNHSSSEEKGARRPMNKKERGTREEISESSDRTNVGVRDKEDSPPSYG